MARRFPQPRSSGSARGGAFSIVLTLCVACSPAPRIGLTGGDPARGDASIVSYARDAGVLPNPLSSAGPVAIVDAASGRDASVTSGAARDAAAVPGVSGQRDAAPTAMGGVGGMGGSAPIGGSAANAVGGQMQPAGMGGAAGHASGGATASGGTPGASADTLFAYEGFSYPDTSLSMADPLEGLAGGFGWLGAWHSHYPHLPNNDIASDLPLVFPGLRTSASFLRHYDNFHGRFVDPRAFDDRSWVSNGRALVGAPGTSLWMSLLVRRSEPLSSPLWVSTASTSEFSYIDDNVGCPQVADPESPCGSVWSAGAFPASACQGRWALFAGDIYTAPATCTTKDLEYGAATLLVIRLDFLPQGGDVALFVNPTAGAVDPGAADATLHVSRSLAFRSVLPNAEGAAEFDEIRLGRTFRAVTPGP